MKKMMIALASASLLLGATSVWANPEAAMNKAGFHGSIK